jgi:FKBP-type peptidyl-prolyl cis-trans isomerase
MKQFVICLLALSSVLSVSAQTSKTKTPTKAVVAAKKAFVMQSLIDSFSYAAGFNVGTNMREQGITSANLALMQKGLDDALKKAACSLTPEQVSSVLQKQIEIFSKAKSDQEKKAGIAYLLSNRQKTGVTTLPSGLQYEIIKRSDAATNKPRAIDTVVVNYIGTTIDGKEFDNSYKRGEPAVFPVGGVIKGWTEILQLMPVGSHWKVTIPSELAYGEYPPPGSGLAPNSVLIFEIILEGVKPAAGDVKAPAPNQ